MRYSVLYIKRTGLGVTPLPSMIGISDGDDMTLESGDLSNYKLVGTDTDGVRLYEQYRLPDNPFDMLFIPETHTYFNSGLLLSNFNTRGRRGYTGELYNIYDNIITINNNR